MADLSSLVRVVIDYSETWESRKAKMNINGYFSSDFNEQNFPIGIGEGQETFEMRLVSTLKEEEEAVKNGWERAKAEHVMAYAASAWDGQTWVIARGSSWRDPEGFLVVPVLLSGDDRKLCLDRGDGRWFDDDGFLIVRKCA